VIASGRGPAPGFLLHSYGGPVEMIDRFARLGAYFSFPGYFLQERKARQREVFRKVPIDRLLVETDAPDQLPPEGFRPFEVPAAADGAILNHPANLPAIQAGLAAFLGHEPEAFSEQLEANFRRLFRAG
jgi:TatD DNase family protein